MLKKNIALILSIMLLICFVLPCEASQPISITVDAHEIYTDTPAVILQGRTLVPMRAVFEALGADVTWNAQTQTAAGTRNGITVELTIGENVLRKNGVQLVLDVPAQIIEDRTMIPVRVVSECFGFSVTWDEASQTVAISTGAAHGNVCAHFLDVGQGDCEFIELPNGKCMLIDAATSGEAEKIINYITKLGYSSIDYVVATHAHADHIGAMTDILKRFPVGNFFMPPMAGTTRTFERMLDALAENGCVNTYARQGVQLFDCDGMKAVFAAPKQDSYSDINDSSAVVRLTYKNASFLFMGDAGEKSENEILRLGTDIKSDVIKIGHHGSETASSADFIRAVSPKYAVISVGSGNSYGLPDESVLDLLAGFSVEVLRTDFLSFIKISTDGETYNVQSGDFL